MWSTPRTWVTGEPVRAAYWNQYVRDNFRSLVWAQDEALTGFEGTTSGTYTDLTTKGPFIFGFNVTSGRVCVILTAVITENTALATGAMSYDMSGPAGFTSASSNFHYIMHGAGNISDDWHGSGAVQHGNLTSGQYGFYCKYAVNSGGGTASFAYRRILVFEVA